MYGTSSGKCQCWKVTRYTPQGIQGLRRCCVATKPDVAGERGQVWHAWDQQRAMAVLEGNPSYTTWHQGTNALLALYKKRVSSQTVTAMFCKPVNPAEGEKHAQIWCAVRSRDALTNHNHALIPADICFLCPLFPVCSVWESVYTIDFFMGLFHQSSALVCPTDGAYLYVGAQVEGRHSGLSPGKTTHLNGAVF